MHISRPPFRNNLFWLPLTGAFLFVVLYTTAAFFYPGGSGADPHAKGFSLLHNYWCNLLNERAINGERNTGRPYAFAALFSLAVALYSFWFLGAHRLQLAAWAKTVVLLCGLVSLVLLPFMPTAYHDWVLNVSASLGMIAMAFIYAALRRRGEQALFSWGMFNVLLVGINNLFYYKTSFLAYLPVVQKLTFASFLLWVCAVCVRLMTKYSDDHP